MHGKPLECLLKKSMIILGIRMSRRKILMIPGPTEISSEVLDAMRKPVIPHYGSEWVQIYRETIAMLKQVLQTTADVFVIGGSASSAMEASIASTIEPGDKVLVELSGMFGLRFKEIVEAHRGKVISLEVKPGDAVSPDEIRKKLENERGIKALIAVHNETSTGVMNPVEELGKISREYGLLYIVDAVSSLGAVELKSDQWNVDLCIAGSNKCLEGSAGLAVVSVSDKAWKAIEGRKEGIRSWYLNLQNIRRYSVMWADWHPQGPVTMSTSLFVALNVALKRVLKEGLQNRFERHRRIAKAVRGAMRAMSLEPFARDESASHTLTAVRVPPGIKCEDLLKTMEDEHDIIISGGLGPTAGKIFRVGHMGTTASVEYVLPTIYSLQKSLKKLGFAATRDSEAKSIQAILEYDKLG